LTGHPTGRDNGHDRNTTLTLHRCLTAKHRVD